MKYHQRIVIALLALFFAAMAGTVTAQVADSDQSSDAIQKPELFIWAKGDRPDWAVGALLAAMGLVGALVTVFGFIGGAVPGTAGSTRLEEGLLRLEEQEKHLGQLLQRSDSGPERTDVVERAVDNLRDDLRTERRWQFSLAAGLYAILGAFFATLLAHDLLQALVIGAGWSAYLGVLGLKKDYAERKSVKDKTTEKLEAALPEAQADDTDDRWAYLRMEAARSRAL